MRDRTTERDGEVRMSERGVDGLDERVMLR
jgi:hypothetical protein